MNLLATTLFLLFQYSNRTPHVNPNATPYPETSGGFDPQLFIIATIGVIALILILGFFVTGFKWPWSKKKNPPTYKSE